MPQEHPVVVIGAGPIGLAAAAHLIEREIPFLVLERGATAGAAISQWGHVSLFSPFVQCVDPASRRLLEAHGWTAPPDAMHPRGQDLVDLYLRPLAELPAMADAIRYDHTVTAITRVGGDKSRPTLRTGTPFAVRARTADGEVEILASHVIDASGTWHQPNPLGAAGVAAIGETAAAEFVATGIPDVAGAEVDDYRGRSVAVVGSGHSAQNVVQAMAQIATTDPDTSVTWLVRRSDPGHMFGGGADDELPARGALGRTAQGLVAGGSVELVTGFRVREVASSESHAWLLAADGRKVGPFDRIINTTGFRPDLEMLREVETDIAWSLESVAELAPLIDPNFHSCGSVPPHGARELAQPEPGLFIVGAKSYGRAPTFLLLTGFEQARSVVALIAGDEAAAYRVELELPETGVCSPLPPTASSSLPILGNSCCG